MYDMSSIGANTYIYVSLWAREILLQSYIHTFSYVYIPSRPFVYSIPT